MKRVISMLLTCIMIGAFLIALPSVASADKPCIQGENGGGGGEWPSYGANLSNSRHQPAETMIDSASVGSLRGAWVLSSVAEEGYGAFQSTPVVAGGCVFAATTSGSIFAVDAISGEVVWHTFKQAMGGVLGGIFAPAIVNDVLYATVGRSGVPYAVALDANTGVELWETNLYQGLADAETHLLSVGSSVVVFDGLVFVALAGFDSFSFSHPSFFILDAEDGSILKKTVVIPQNKWLEGYSGGGIWGTGVVDTQTKHLFVGTANPYNKRREHKHTNAIIKISVDRGANNFGEISEAYRGDKDYDPKLYNTPQCKYLGELQPVGFSYFCGQRDIDFGASPNLYTNSAGQTIVLNLQKSCTVHAVFGDTMERFWKQKEVGPGRGGAAGCASTTAYDDRAIYVVVNEGAIFALDRDTGETIWKTRYGDLGSHYQPVTVANGVVYTAGNNGKLYAFDAITGKVLFNDRIKGPEGETCAATQGAGVSVARNMVFVSCDSLSGASVPVPFVNPGGGAVFAYSLKGN